MELEPKTFEPTDSQLSAEGRSLDRSHGEAVNLCWGDVGSPGYMIICRSTSPELDVQALGLRVKNTEKYFKPG